MSLPSPKSKDKPRKRPGLKQLVRSVCHPVLYAVSISSLDEKTEAFLSCKLGIRYIEGTVNYILTRCITYC
jgi:hypothetical protein